MTGEGSTGGGNTGGGTSGGSSKAATGERTNSGSRRTGGGGNRRNRNKSNRHGKASAGNGAPGEGVDGEGTAVAPTKLPGGGGGKPQRGTSGGTKTGSSLGPAANSVPSSAGANAVKGKKKSSGRKKKKSSSAAANGESRGGSSSGAGGGGRTGGGGRGGGNRNNQQPHIQLPQKKIVIRNIRRSHLDSYRSRLPPKPPPLVEEEVVAEEKEEEEEGPTATKEVTDDDEVIASAEEGEDGAGDTVDANKEEDGEEGSNAAVAKKKKKIPTSFPEHEQKQSEQYDLVQCMVLLLRDICCLASKAVDASALPSFASNIGHPTSTEVQKEIRWDVKLDERSVTTSLLEWGFPKKKRSKGENNTVLSELSTHWEETRMGDDAASKSLAAGAGVGDGENTATNAWKKHGGGTVDHLVNGMSSSSPGGGGVTPAAASSSYPFHLPRCITARLLYVQPPRASKRRGEIAGCAYLILSPPPYKPPPPPPIPPRSANAVGSAAADTTPKRVGGGKRITDEYEKEQSRGEQDVIGASKKSEGLSDSKESGSTDASEVPNAGGDNKDGKDMGTTPPTSVVRDVSGTGAKTGSGSVGDNKPAQPPVPSPSNVNPVVEKAKVMALSRLTLDAALDSLQTASSHLTVQVVLSPYQKGFVEPRYDLSSVVAPNGTGGSSVSVGLPPKKPVVGGPTLSTRGGSRGGSGGTSRGGYNDRKYENTLESTDDYQFFLENLYGKPLAAGGGANDASPVMDDKSGGFAAATTGTTNTTTSGGDEVGANGRRANADAVKGGETTTGVAEGAATDDAGDPQVQVAAIVLHLQKKRAEEEKEKERQRLLRSKKKKALAAAAAAQTAGASAAGATTSGRTSSSGKKGGKTGRSGGEGKSSSSGKKGSDRSSRKKGPSSSIANGGVNPATVVMKKRSESGGSGGVGGIMKATSAEGAKADSGTPPASAAEGKEKKGKVGRGRGRGGGNKKPPSSSASGGGGGSLAKSRGKSGGGGRGAAATGAVK